MSIIWSMTQKELGRSSLCGSSSADKFIVLGIITESPELEDPDDMFAKVHEEARHIANGQNRSYEAVLDQICISPQCGFASSWEGNCKVSDLDMRHKLQLLNKVSKMIWGP